MTFSFDSCGRSKQWSPRSYARTATHCYVTYQYTVSGRQYLSGRIDAVTTGGADYPHHYMARYPRGAEVRVHSDPADPIMAVLETSWPIGTTLEAFLALAIAILLLHGAYRARPIAV